MAIARQISMFPDEQPDIISELPDVIPELVEKAKSWAGAICFKNQSGGFFV